MEVKKKFRKLIDSSIKSYACALEPRLKAIPVLRPRIKTTYGITQSYAPVACCLKIMIYRYVFIMFI